MSRNCAACVNLQPLGKSLPLLWWRSHCGWWKPATLICYNGFLPFSAMTERFASITNHNRKLILLGLNLVNKYQWLIYSDRNNYRRIHFTQRQSKNKIYTAATIFLEENSQLVDVVGTSVAARISRDRLSSLYAQEGRQRVAQSANIFV